MLLNIFLVVCLHESIGDGYIEGVGGVWINLICETLTVDYYTYYIYNRMS